MTEISTHTLGNGATKRLERSRSDRKLAGVCGGLARYFDIHPAVYRVGFVVLTLLGGAGILIYLAAKSGKFLPASDRGKYDALQWLMFQMGGVGPMIGQAHHFIRSAKEQVPYGIERYSKETRRLYGVLDKRLATEKYLAAGEYTIADIATYAWIARYEWHKVDLNDFPNVKRWFDAISARPAVGRGMDVPKR